ncbi:hypothetical protein EYF80_013621 [Liparis tanakae]|uniref:Uncharacterized protein n=1 Tax=Liparis tanakae TaxID=230148 RepID=A0A4Z2IDQ2_9TELE|nr:hypothetical protein EYF80_013621 [Liparis tanakae]
MSLMIKRSRDPPSDCNGEGKTSDPGAFSSQKRRGEEQWCTNTSVFIPRQGRQAHPRPKVLKLPPPPSLSGEERQIHPRLSEGGGEVVKVRLADGRFLIKVRGIIRYTTPTLNGADASQEVHLSSRFLEEGDATVLARMAGSSSSGPPAALLVTSPGFLRRKIPFHAGHAFRKGKTKARSAQLQLYTLCRPSWNQWNKPSRTRIYAVVQEAALRLLWMSEQKDAWRRGGSCLIEPMERVERRQTAKRLNIHVLLTPIPMSVTQAFFYRFYISINKPR